MWLKLDLGDPVIHFRVRGYHNRRNEKIISDDDWCVVDLDVEYNKNFIYQLHDDESLENAEVLWLEEVIDGALNGRVPGCTEIEPVEPYMAFSVYSHYDLATGTFITEEQKKAKTPKRYTDFPFMKWKVILWDNDGAPSESKIELAIYDDRMKLLLKYLKFLRGTVSKDDPEIKEMIDKGIIYGDIR